MVRLVTSLLLAAALCLPAVASASAPATMTPIASASSAPDFVAFHSHFGFGGLRRRSTGFGGLGRRGTGFGATGRRHGFLRRVVRTAAWLYVLHLFFSHGGLSILLWIVLIAIVVSLMRRRRRRYAY